MPELPDVEIFRRRLDKAAAGRRITEAKVRDPRLLEGISARELERRLLGRRIEATQRHGKYLIAKLEDGDALVLHFGMTGTIETSAEGATTPLYEVLHIGLEKGGWASVTSRRKLGHIWMTGSISAFLKDHEQGPDALAKALNIKAFAAALGSKRSTLKAALMDQARIAGIGNIYSDEILFQTGLHPLTLVGDLDPDQLAELYRTTKRVLRQAIARGVMAEGPASAFPDDWLSGHRERGGRCPRCRTPLETFKSGGRTAYFCPRCQPRRAARH
ncbi:MAG: Fpg/Nei family DNA glycosylase [Hyphomicrobiaceae bacterium]